MTQKVSVLDPRPEPHFENFNFSFVIVLVYNYYLAVAGSKPLRDLGACVRELVAFCTCKLSRREGE